MRKQRITLLAGIAAVALIAGAGAASAQQTGNEQHGAKQPHAASQQMHKAGATMGENAGAQNKMGGKMDQKAAEENRAGGKMGQNAAEENKGGGKMDRNAAEEKSTSSKMGQHAEQTHRNMTQHSAQDNRGKQRTTAERDRNKRQTTAQQRERFGNHQNAAQRNERNGQKTAAEERNGLKGLQGNARVNVQLNDEQRTRIRETVIDARGAPRIDHVNFNIAVGTVVPRTGVRFVPVPATLVRIEPAWRGLRYFIYEQELVLIDPATMTIVAVVTV
jgi:Protein of unknown function (DUF1236)